MPKFYFDPTSETAEGGYHIITDDGSYYDHVGGHSEVHPSNINPAHEITKAEYLAHVPASKVPTEYIADSLPCHVCGTLISIEELNENAAYTYPENLPYCPDHQPCPDCFATDGKHTRASCTE